MEYMSNESPTSVTYSLISPNGFPLLLTLRDEKMFELLINMGILEESLKTKGFKPQEKKSFGPKPPAEIVPDRKCPTCNNSLVYAMIKGERVIKCSTNKWNPATKQAEGCKFIEWPK